MPSENVSIWRRAYPPRRPLSFLRTDLEEVGLNKTIYEKKGIGVIGILLLSMALIAGFLMLHGCNMSGAPDTTGDLLVSFSDLVTPQNLEPSISMEITEYHLVVTASDGTTIVYDQNVAGDTVINGLQPDTYTIDGEALNDTAAVIGSGSGSATVEIGSTATANITVTETAGTGTADVTVDWSGGEPVYDPNITSSLAYGSGTADPLSWTLGTVSASWFDDTLANGWYSLAFALYDDGAAQPSAGFATLVRIVTGQTTSGTVNLSPVAGSGSLEVLIDSDFYTPLAATPTPAEGAVDIVPSQGVQTFEIASDGGENAIWTWYVQGVADTVDNGVNISAFQFDPAAYEIGDTVRLDVIGVTSDGKQAADASWTISIVDGLELTWTLADPANHASINVYLTDSSTAYDSGDLAAGVESHTVIGLSEGTDYILYIREKDDANQVLSKEYWEEYRSIYYSLQNMPYLPRPAWLPKPGWQRMMQPLIDKYTYTALMQDIVDLPEETHDVIKLKAPNYEQNEEWEPAKQFSEDHRLEQCGKDTEITNISRGYRKVVVVCRYREQIDELQTKLSKERETFVLDGRTRDVGQVVADAENSSECYLIIQAQVGAGFELPSFAVMIFASQSYGARDYTQMKGRIKRINALKPLKYFYLLAGRCDTMVYNTVQDGKDFIPSEYLRPTT